MACQWEDEQTGGHCPDLAEHFTGTTHKWFTFTNGAHIDSLDPYTFDRWYDFLELFVAHQAPIVNAGHPAAAPVIYQAAMGIPKRPRDAAVRPDPEDPDLLGRTGRVREAPAVRVLFDNGAGRSPIGAVTPGIRIRASSVVLELPDPGDDRRPRGTSGPAGRSAAAPPAHEAINWYTSNASALPPTDYSGNTGAGGLWANASAWQWNWQQNPAGTAVSYVTAPLKTNTTVIGAGAVHVWVRVLDARRRPPGHGQRGAPRRQGDVRPERLDACQRAQARHRLEQHVQAAEHAARADPEPAGRRRVGRCRRHSSSRS